MISIEERKALGIQKCTLEGHPCHVAGYRMPDATITADFEGFWRCEWETVKRVIEGTRNFTANDVSFVSMQWKGTGEEMPEALRRKVLR